MISFLSYLLTYLLTSAGLRVGTTDLYYLLYSFAVQETILSCSDGVHIRFRTFRRTIAVLSQGEPRDAAVHFDIRIESYIGHRA